MLRSTNELKGFTIRATDGDVGSVDDVYFDDEKWAVRYIVVDTGGWLGRRVLVSPVSFTSSDWAARAMNVSLTKDRIRNSPEAQLYAPISREYERQYSAYYGYPTYWGGAGLWAAGGYPGSMTSAAAGARSRPSAAAVEERADTHLRSASEVKGYHIHATDGDIGHIDDFIIDDESWAIRYLRVDTSNWIGGRAVVVPQSALSRVSWPDATLSVKLTKQQVHDSPEFDPGMLNDGLGERLGAYYGGR